MRGPMLEAGARTALVLASAAALLFLGCAPRPRMCRTTGECSPKSVCVAGRCQLDSTSVRPAVDSARRLVVRPVDLAYVSKGEAASDDALPMVAPLGKHGGRLLLRFEVTVPPAANVVEAYIVLRRSPWVDDDPAPVSLHATRIIEAWQGGSISWARQPRLADGRLPATTVDPAGPALVRVDVREIVRQWQLRDRHDHGVAILAESDSSTGMTFALLWGGAEEPPRPKGAGAMTGGALETGPYLELYLR